MKGFEKQVATFSQSITLHSLGVRHDPVCWWKSSAQNPHWKQKRWLSFEKEGYYRICFPAFTIKELGEIIPDTIKTAEGESDLMWYKKDGVFWCEYFIDGNELKQLHATNEAILRGFVLITLIKSGYYSVFSEEDNKIN